MRSRVLGLIKRIVLIVAVAIGLYLVVALAGLYPVNRDFLPSEEGVEIFVFSGQVHSDLILPIENDIHSWWDLIDPDSFPTPPTTESYLAIGWGEKKFYTETPTWESLKLSTVGWAMFWPTDTVMHVEMLHPPATGDNLKSVRISNEQYQKLVAFIQDHFEKDTAGQIVQLDVSFGQHDSFYEANGNYHIFRTCNCWVGEALQESGVKVGWWTPLPKSVFWHLAE